MRSNDDLALWVCMPCAQTCGRQSRWASTRSNNSLFSLALLSSQARTLHRGAHFQFFVDVMQWFEFVWRTLEPACFRNCSARANASCLRLCSAMSPIAMSRNTSGRGISVHAALQESMTRRARKLGTGLARSFDFVTLLFGSKLCPAARQAVVRCLNTSYHADGSSCHLLAPFQLWRWQTDLESA